MDRHIEAAAHALAAGDPLAALNRIALREDAPALALRGIAMAQLGELARARVLVRRAARAFGPHQAVAHARCVLAEAEIALAARDLGLAMPALRRAGATLQARGDLANAAHARLLQARQLLLTGRLAQARAVLDTLEAGSLAAPLRALHGLIAAGIAMRRLQAAAARRALVLAAQAARQAGIPALAAEISHARRFLHAPAACLLAPDGPRPLRLADVEALLATGTLVVDACRYVVQCADAEAALAGRPVLFALARCLARHWPQEAPRDALIAEVFRIRCTDETHRARLRVELGRLRGCLRGLAQVQATRLGYRLVPRGAAAGVAVLVPPTAGSHAHVLALLADGRPWSSSSLAQALGSSQRTVQRALESLAGAGRAQAVGRGRARRWIAPPVPGFTTTLLLPWPPEAH